ncbi:MAG: hypothetical protein D6778_01570 [Nitrospirae bacterium]|nr:MAG: hypothetical protein D6778_01570 [Nitrospirota bacterium]
MKELKNKGLLQDVYSEDLDRRFSALRALIGTDERALRPAIQALKEGPPPLKAMAVKVLSSLDPEIVGMVMIFLLRWYPSLRGPVIEVLQKLKPFEMLRETLLKDSDNQMRILGLQLIETFGYRKGIEQDLERAFYDKDTNVRCAALKAIASLGVKELYWTFQDALKEEDEWMLFYALTCISKARPEGIERYLSNVLHHGSEFVRIAAIECLGALATETALSMLEDRLKTATGKERKLIIRTLIRASRIEKTEEFLNELFDCLYDDDLSLVKSALRGLCSFADKTVVSRLLDWIGSFDDAHPEYPDLKNSVINCLKDMKRPDILFEVLKEGNLRFRALATGIKALGEMSYHEAAGWFIDCLGGPQRDIRRASARALYKTARVELFDKIKPFLNDKDGHVRQWVARTLVRLGMPIKEIMEFLSHEPYENVNEEVIKELLKREPLSDWYKDLPEKAIPLVVRNLKDQSSIEVFLEHPSNQVRKVAIRKLAVLNPELVATMNDRPEDKVVDCILELYNGNHKPMR